MLCALGRAVLLKHALPNAIGPIANAIVLSLANLFFGLIIIEGIFQYPGMGHLLLTSVSNRDIPLVQACALLAAAVYIGFNLVADLLGILNNPRLRYPSTPVEFRWIRKEWIDALIVNWKAATASVVISLAVIGGVSAYLSERVEKTDWSKIPSPTEAERSKLTVAELLSEAHLTCVSRCTTTISSRLVLPNRPDTLSKASCASRASPQDAAGQTRTSRRQREPFQRLKPDLVVHGDILLPLERDDIASGEQRRLVCHPVAWTCVARIRMTATGRAGLLPFTITGLRGYAAHYGVLTFLFNDQSISRVRVQIAQETANWSQYDLWGQVEAARSTGSLSPVSGRRGRTMTGARCPRLDVRPWSELAAQHWRSLELFDGKGNRENVAASGLMVDDTVYLRPCRTRAGPHPFCREMRYGVFSISKTLGAAMSMLWLAQKYGPEVFDEKITDYVSIPAGHDGWTNVTFGNALDMTSGIGDTTPYRVDQYVEADQTRKGNRVWRAASIREKLDGIAQFNNYPWRPGEVTRYRSTDTTALTAALEAYLRRKEGAGRRSLAVADQRGLRNHSVSTACRSGARWSRTAGQERHCSPAACIRPSRKR